MNKLDKKYDDFEVRYFNFTSKNYDTNEKLECFSSSGYDGNIKLPVTLNFFYENRINRQSFDGSINDLMVNFNNATRDLNDFEIGDYIISIVDSKGNVVRKINFDKICIDKEVEVFDIGVLD